MIWSVHQILVLLALQTLTTAKDQLRGVDVAKMQLMATQLETIVSMFNSVMSDTSVFASYEQALFEQTLSKISQVRPFHLFIDVLNVAQVTSVNGSF
jgi:hypothetical protein